MFRDFVPGSTPQPPMTRRKEYEMVVVPTVNHQQQNTANNISSSHNAAGGGGGGGVNSANGGNAIALGGGGEHCESSKSLLGADRAGEDDRMSNDGKRQHSSGEGRFVNLELNALIEKPVFPAFDIVKGNK